MSAVTVKTLLIGGPFNGQRMICDPSLSTIPMQAFTRDAPFVPSDNTNTTLFEKSPTFKSIYATYYLINLGYGFYVGLYDKLKIEEGIELLLSRYPKQRKKGLGSTRKYKIKNDWGNARFVDPYFLSELKKYVMDSVGIPQHLLDTPTPISVPFKLTRQP